MDTMKIETKYGWNNANDLALELSGGYLSIDDEEAELVREFLTNNDADIPKMISRITDEGIENADSVERFTNYLHELNKQRRK